MREGAGLRSRAHDVGAELKPAGSSPDRLRLPVSQILGVCAVRIQG